MILKLEFANCNNLIVWIKLKMPIINETNINQVKILAIVIVYSTSKS